MRLTPMRHTLCRPSNRKPACTRTTDKAPVTTSAKSVVIAMMIDGDGLWEHAEEEGHHARRPCQEASRTFHPSAVIWDGG